MACHSDGEISYSNVKASSSLHPVDQDQDDSYSYSSYYYSSSSSSSEDVNPPEPLKSAKAAVTREDLCDERASLGVQRIFDDLDSDKKIQRIIDHTLDLGDFESAKSIAKTMRVDSFKLKAFYIIAQDEAAHGDLISAKETLSMCDFTMYGSTKDLIKFHGVEFFLSRKIRNISLAEETASSIDDSLMRALAFLKITIECSLQSDSC
jgi:hypothetical protein